MASRYVKRSCSSPVCSLIGTYISCLSDQSTFGGLRLAILAVQTTSSSFYCKRTVQLQIHHVPPLFLLTDPSTRMHAFTLQIRVEFQNKCNGERVKRSYFGGHPKSSQKINISLFFSGNGLGAQRPFHFAFLKLVDFFGGEASEVCTAAMRKLEKQLQAKPLKLEREHRLDLDMLRGRLNEAF